MSPDWYKSLKKNGGQRKLFYTEKFQVIHVDTSASRRNKTPHSLSVGSA